MIRIAPRLVVALMALPVAAGLAGAMLPAFGYFPALGGMAFSLDPWRDLLAWPGLAKAVRLSLVTGLGATLLSLAINAADCRGMARHAQLSRGHQPAGPAFCSLPPCGGGLWAGLSDRALGLDRGARCRHGPPGWDRPPDLLIRA